MKIVQLMMVCAIFNPFCCCTAAVLTADDIAPTSGAHSCCSNTEETTNLPDTQHNPESCPHKALKEYQATALKDLSASCGMLVLPPAQLTVVEFFIFLPLSEARPAVSLATVSQAPPQPLSQRYCVYRI